MTATDYSWDDYTLGQAMLDRERRLKEAMEKAIAEGSLVKKEEPDYHAKQDRGKAKLTLVPRRILWDIAAIREYGNNKYPEGGPDNWKEVEIDRYRDAAYRHFLKYLDDPNGVDDESGLPHLWHLACNIAFLCEMEKENFKDDDGTIYISRKAVIESHWPEREGE